MSYAESRAVPGLMTVDGAEVSERVAFIRRTYAHLTGAILAFAALEYVILNLPVTERLVAQLLNVSYGWLLVLGAFMVVGWLADRWAHSDASPGLQYAGLAIYVLAEAAIFAPLLYLAKNVSSPDVIPSAAIVTLTVFGGLTILVFITKTDFSFLRAALSIAGFLALGLIVCSIIFGFNLGIIFAFAMVGLAAGYILYYTSNVLHHYRTTQHVAAALALFASVALMFWYILMIFMSRD